MINTIVNLSEITYETVPVRAELVESIRTRGIAIPVHVNRMEEGYSCVDGRRRLSAAAILAAEDERFARIPVDGSEKDGKVRYQVSQPLTMNRAPYVEEIPLPAGTYYLEYEVIDVFMRSTIMDRIEFKWDGENMTLSQDDAWMD